MANFSSSSWLSFIYRFDFISQKNSLDCPLYTGLTISISQKYSLDCPLYTGLTLFHRNIPWTVLYIQVWLFISQKDSLDCSLYTALTIFISQKDSLDSFIYRFDYIYYAPATIGQGAYCFTPVRPSVRSFVTL